MTLGERRFEYVEIDATQDVGSGPATQTYRFSRIGQPPPIGIDALPMLVSTQQQKTRLDISRGLGIRERVVIRMLDQVNDGDVLGGDPATETTFWRLFRARVPFLNGRALRIVRGTVNAGTFTATTTLHYVVRRIVGPRSSGDVEIEAEDLTGSLARGKAQAPALGTGTLLAGIDASATAATINPASAADDYPASGYLRIGDSNEVISFTRSGASLTLTRGALSTTAEAHAAGDEIQAIVRWADQRICDVVRDLLVSYGGIPSAQIDLADWQAADDLWLGLRISRIVWDPTDVAELLQDLVRIFPFVIWYDPEGPSWGFRPLEAAAFASDATRIRDLDGIVAGSLQVQEDPDQAWTRLLFLFGPKDFSEDLSDPRNYSRARPFVNSAAEAATARGQKVLRVLPVSWLPSNKEVDVDRLGFRLQKLGENDRRTYSWTSPAEIDLDVGDFARLVTDRIVTSDGSPKQTAVIIISKQRINEGAQIEYEATDLYYDGRYRRWAPDGLPTYDAAIPAQTDRYLYLADDTPTLGAAGDPAHDWL